MTPTEQDNELELDRYAMSIVHLVGRIQSEKLPETITSTAFVDLRQASNDNAIDAIKQLITADRKRVALEARIEENRRWLTVLAPSMDENVAYNSDFHQRIAQLKAQQEEV